MRYRKLGIGLACATLLAAGMSAGYSQAQDTPPAQRERGAGPGFGAGPGGPGGPGFHRGRGEQRGERRGFRGARFDPSKRIEGRIAFLKAELKITDAQNRAFDQYAAFMRDNAKARSEAIEKARTERDARKPAEAGQRPQRPSVSERMNNQEQRLEAQLAATKKRKAATEALYKVLSDEQKKLAEELL
jgi:hypothetical protein